MLRKSILAMAGAVLLSSGFAINPANADPVPFSIGGVSFTTGSGYGIDANESLGTPTLLDVRFSIAGFVAQNFSLTALLPTQSFLFGTVNLQEENSGSGIEATETDNLGVTANLLITNPTGTQSLIALVGVVEGSVNDSFADYSLVWTPLLVNFGTGGQFRIDLNNLVFSGPGSQNLNATITLLASGSPNAVVPEPGTLSLLGLGLAGLAFAARKRKRTT